MAWTRTTSIFNAAILSATCDM